MDHVRTARTPSCLRSILGITWQFRITNETAQSGAVSVSDTQVKNFADSTDGEKSAESDMDWCSSQCDYCSRLRIIFFNVLTALFLPLDFFFMIFRRSLCLVRSLAKYHTRFELLDERIEPSDSGLFIEVSFKLFSSYDVIR